MEKHVIIKIVVVVVLLIFVAMLYIDTSPKVTGLVILEPDSIPTAQSVLGVGNAVSLMFSNEVESTDFIESFMNSDEPQSSGCGCGK